MAKVEGSNPFIRFTQHLEIDWFRNLGPTKDAFG
jgi:hypothetical protein